MEAGIGADGEPAGATDLAAAGAVLYVERDGNWYRLGESLPRFEVPPGDGSEWPLLEQTIFPEPVKAVPSREDLKAPIRIRLVRDRVPVPRPAGALRCWPRSLAAWAERATSGQIAALEGAWLAAGASDAREALVLVIGSAESLPMLAEGMRFWGTELLVPMGLRPEPNLPASAIRSAAGARPEELAVLDEDGIELIPRAIFKPLSRAAIRMMREGDVANRENSS